jgi:peptide/nickel transport system substrate-binding protein
MAFQAAQGDVQAQTTGGESQARDLINVGFNYEQRVGAMMALIPDSAHPDSIFANQKVREAVEYAIDRESIAKALGYGFSVAVNQPAIKRHFGYIEGYGRKYDPAKAKQLLAEAGYPNGFKTVIHSSATFSQDPLVSIQSYLKAVGIDVQLDIVAFAAWNDMVMKGWNNSLIFVTQGATDANYSGFLQRYYDVGAVRYPVLLKPKAVTDLITKSLNATDYAVQKAAAQDAVKMIVDNAMTISLWANYAVFLEQKYVREAGFGDDSWGVNAFRWTPNKAWLNK